jgi:hypothetical protein
MDHGFISTKGRAGAGKSRRSQSLEDARHGLTIRESLHWHRMVPRCSPSSGARTPLRARFGRFRFRQENRAASAATQCRRQLASQMVASSSPKDATYALPTKTASTRASCFPFLLRLVLPACRQTESELFSR